ncbi:TylF/MycF/NovP-related O-methyltransferase [Sphingomonas sp. MMS24-J13]|uniref:TylF/MycF/NovP-related O-methyltransferase n=1 Tax=Sphingomonas sp. MMS24-J13 TaxID=3238686 RepID=UPI00384E564C
MARLRRNLAPKGNVDALAGARVAGWALGRGPLSVEAWVGDRCVAHSFPAIHRPDVAHAYPDHRRAATCGFAFDLPAGAIASDALAELRIVARPTRRWLPSATIASFQMAGDGLERKLSEARNGSIVGPFPKQVIDAIAAVWPEECADLGSVAGQARFAARVKQIMLTPGLNALPVFADYARYLATTLAHCRFVERHFPATNRQAEAGAADFHCKPNSVRELFAIIHQLYVLKSWGVTGDFAEFGCFKGYSSAMLSFACSQLGLNMHVFNSFEGLPPAAGSGYEAGQYAGGLDEVRDHVARFGAINCVTFHKGFFADTFREWRPPALMCLWMDVDLEVSARDLMVIADALDPRSSLFSHECNASIFEDGHIITSPSPDNPIPPMLARHEELGRPLTGRYVAGYTGAFWPRSTGIPVVDTEVLADLARNLGV